MPNLNLGCGPEPTRAAPGEERYAPLINYDVKLYGDVCGNCEEGLPFKSETFFGVIASHILEHIHDLRALKAEIHRVLVKGGRLAVTVPYYLSPDAWGDDTHCRGFSDQSFFLDFWPGFKLLRLKHQRLMKMANNEEVEWIHVLLEKT